MKDEARWDKLSQALRLLAATALASLNDLKALNQATAPPWPKPPKGDDG